MSNKQNDNLYHAMIDAGWRNINGSWANPQQVKEFEESCEHLEGLRLDRCPECWKQVLSNETNEER